MFLKGQFTDNRDHSTYLVGRRQTKQMLKSSFKSRNHIQKRETCAIRRSFGYSTSSAVLYTKDLTTQDLTTQ